MVIDLETELALVPDSIRAKWELPKEVAKGLTYREGIKIKVPETTDDLAKIADYLLRDPKALIGFDTEATSQRPESAQIVGLSFSDDDGSGFYVPVGHEHGQNIDLDDALELLMPVFQLRLSMAGGKYDWHLLRRHGVDVQWGFDSQSLSRLLGEVEYGVGLKPTVARMFGERMIEFSDLVSKAKQKKGANFSIVEIGVAAQYATADAVYTRMVSLRALRTLPASVRGMLLKVEHEVMRIAGEMEWNGLPLDTEYLATKIEAGETMAQTLRREAIEGLQTLAASLGKAGQIPDDLNMNSNDQMTEALFEVCGLPVQKRSKKTKKPSVDKTVIKALAVSVPEVDWIRRFRGAEARVHDLRELYDFRLRKDGWDWVHGGLTPTGAATGRWSSSKPNLQNIPNGESVYESHHSEWRVSIRDAITAPPGWNIVTADYGQIELRVAAGESHCRFWLDGFAAGFDAHAMSGAAIHGVSTEQVTYAQRHDGKTFNFALLFGQEAKATAALLGISVAEAKHMQEAFWEGLPEVKTWIDGTYAFVKEHKYVETRFGRRRWLRGIDDDNRYIMLQNRRESVNTIVQGTAADILKIGLVRS